MKPPDHALDIDLKRQVVYGALLRYTGEAQQLRNRVIDRLILGALADTDIDDPLKTGELQTRCSIGSTTDIRTETIQDALKRLEQTGFVEYTRVRLKRAYYLTDRGRQEVQQATASGTQLLDAALTRNLKDLPADADKQVAASVFRGFLAQCFARLGLEIAKTVTGRIGRDDLVRMPQVIDAFKEACDGHSISGAARESMEARCIAFLRSTHPDDERLKLYLTQAFFFTQLLGMRGVQFDPLAEQAFSGSVLYLDTNTLLPRLLRSDGARVFDEVVAAAKKLGIELRITRATIDEARRVAADRKNQLTKIIDKGVPEELILRSNDVFAEAFLERRDQQHITLDEFFAPFDRLSDFVQNELGITLDDVIEEDMLKDQTDADDIGRAIQEESEAIRHRKKGLRTLEHDVAHFVMIGGQRQDQPKTWFLTNDRSVIQAASRLSRGGGPPLCFGLSGLLQTLSPFVTSEAEHSLADMFSAMLTDSVRLPGNAYDMDELVVLADLHEDVLATRDENLVQAIDFVKTRVLQGQPFRSEHAQRNALELRRHLASSVGERERASAGERVRLSGELVKRGEELRAAEDRHEELETQSEAQRLRISELEGEVARLERANTGHTTTLDNMQSAIAARDRKDARNRAVLLSVAGLVIALWHEAVAGLINVRVSDVGPYWDWLLKGVRIAGLMLVAVPWTLFIRSAAWRNDYRIAALFGVFTAVYALLPGVTDGWATVFSDPFVWIALAVSILLARRD